MSELNWRELPAGQELDVLIAKRIGYTDIYHADLAGNQWLVGTDPEGLKQPIRYYSSSLNATMMLITKNMRLSLHNEDDPIWHAVVYLDEGNPPFELFVGSAEEPALAICRAWLAWKDKQGE
jgi:hypothetical protein